MKFYAFHEAIETRMGDSVFRWLEVEASCTLDAALKIIDGGNSPEYREEFASELGHEPLLSDYMEKGGWGACYADGAEGVILFEDNTHIALSTSKEKAALLYCTYRINTEGAEVNIIA